MWKFPMGQKYILESVRRPWNGQEATNRHDNVTTEHVDSHLTYCQLKEIQEENQ